MNDAQLLEKLGEVAKQLGIDLRWDEGEFSGGICRLRDRRILVINRSLPTAVKVKVLCRELAHLDISSIFVLPAIRAQIESHR